jgi:aldose 1-epimerase
MGLFLLLESCTSITENKGKPEISDKWPFPDSNAFNKILDEKPVKLFTLRNGNGMVAAITNYGGRLVGLWVPDKHGTLRNIVLGFDSAIQYKNSTEPYFGALIGRFGNRIAKGKFVLNGNSYSLATNNGVNHLHGGIKGFHNVVWNAVQSEKNILTLTYHSPDGEEGYPGNLDVEVTYILTDENTLTIDYEAKSDAPTIINLTNHAFFNLNGAGAGTINHHVLHINANEFLEVDSTLIPVGKPKSVKATPFDFRSPVRISDNLNDTDPQLINGKGYDHNFVLNRTKVDGLEHAATIIGDQSGIKMEIHTVEPGLQFYGGNFMRGNNKMFGGFTDSFRTAFCLEPQHFPDAPNRNDFPSTVIMPGEMYRTSSHYHFSIYK